MGQNPYFPVNNDLGALETFAGATAGGHTGDLASSGARGVKIVVDLTAVTSSPSLVVTVKNKDVASGTYQTVLASAAILATGVTELTIFPGAAATTNVSANDHLSALWRVEWTLSGGSVTGTIGACLLV